MPERPSKIYSATYSNVPVYEFNVSGNHIMRRRSDDWINATHILKIADYDKPARTRILEREVQKGVHEKIQGGYGKYQGTWIPLSEGRTLAEKNGVLEKLLPIFDFVPGDRSPPPAPKHATATTSKPRAPRQSNGSRKAQSSSQQQDQQTQQPTQQQRQQRQQRPQQQSQMTDVTYDAYSTRETPERASAASESDHVMMNPQSQFSDFPPGRNRKRKRQLPEEPEAMSYEEQQHLLWTDELLDYFMLQNSNDPLPAPPEPPQTIDLNRAVDEKGHTPMHWAAAMGDLAVVRDLVHSNARIDSPSFNGETPLMRSVLFTNNFDKQTMDRLIQILQQTIHQKDYCGSTVFHHITATTCSKSKYQCARYYLEAILDRVSGTFAPQQIADLLNQRDQNGDTAILIAARFGARKCIRTLLRYGASATIVNLKGQKAEELIEQLNARRRERYGLNGLTLTSSSPVNNGVQNASASGNAHQPNTSLSNLFAHQSGSNGGGPLLSSATGTPHSLKYNLDGAKRQKLTSYHSEAAQLLASQLPVLISSRTEALASALETELLERESEVAEGERVLETRRQDLAELKTRYENLKTKSSGRTEHVEAEDTELKELRFLEDEARQLLKQEQIQEISKFLKSKGVNDSFVSADDSGIALLTNGISRNTSPSGQDESMIEVTEPENEGKLRLAQLLAKKQAEHVGLLEAVITAQANEVDEAQAESQKASKEQLYKRLITAALAIPSGDVDAMLPDILQELEEGKRENEHGMSFSNTGVPTAGTESKLFAADPNYGYTSTHVDVSMLDADGARESSVRVAG